MIYFYRLVLFSLTFFFVNHNVDAQSRCYNIDTNYIDFLNLGVLGNTITKGYTISNKLFYTEEFSQDDSVGYGSSVSDNYYFGGSIPSNVVSPNGGAAVSGIISNSTYSLIESDSCVEFSICADFFNTSLNASYNESAIWVGPANYKFFNPISRFENNNVSTYSTREGFFIVILHQSKKIYFINNRDDVTPTENAILIGSYLGDYVGVNQSICQGNVYSINGKIYSTAGSYRDTLKNAASNGCDSIVNTNLTVKNTVTFNNPQTICFGKSYTINGKTYTSWQELTKIP
jgi:hypothetical protein